MTDRSRARMRRFASRLAIVALAASGLSMTAAPASAVDGATISGTVSLPPASPSTQRT